LRPLPPATVYVIGYHALTPISAASRVIGKPLNIECSSAIGWASGSSLIALARTSQGLTAYAMSDGHTVVPIDVATDTAGKPIRVGALFSAAIAASPNGAVVYVVGSNGNNKPGILTPIDTATGTSGRPIPVGVQPDAIAFSPDGKVAYVANVDDNTVTPIDVAKGTPGKAIPAQQGPNAFHILFTPDGRTAYVAGPEITPIDVATGTAEPAIPVDAGDIAITPDGKTLYALTYSSPTSTVTPIDTATNTPGTAISAQDGGELLMAPDGKTLYVVGQMGVMTPIDTATNTAAAAITDNRLVANDMAITPDGKTIYITDFEDSDIVPFDTATQTMGMPIKLKDVPQQVVVAP